MVITRKSTSLVPLFVLQNTIGTRNCLYLSNQTMLYPPSSYIIIRHIKKLCIDITHAFSFGIEGEFVIAAVRTYHCKQWQIHPYVNVTKGSGILTHLNHS